MTEKYRGHVVLVPYPLQGHLNPILQFAKRLASKRVKATVAVTVNAVPSITAKNVAVEPISDGFDQSGFAQAPSVHIYSNSFRTNGSRTLTQLIQKYQNSDHPIDCVVYDSFAPWVLDVAREHGLHGVSFFTNNLTVCSVMSLVHNGTISIPIEPDSGPFIVPGLPPLNFIDLPSFITRHRLSHSGHLAVLMEQFINLDKADLMFVNSFEGLETKVSMAILDTNAKSEAFPGKLIGPMIPSAYLDSRIEEDKGYGSSLLKPLSKECMEWLETKQPQSVVFVSFGSMSAIADKQMHEVAFGLEDSGLNFLWVIKENDRSKLPEGFMESNKDRSLFVSWCNQLEVLAHRAVGCFVTHCGWNSTLEGLSLGVPMVGMPQWSDQFCDAKYIEELWQVGYWAKEDGKEGVVKRDELVRCLKGVTEGEKSSEIRKNAQKWRELAINAVSDGGSSDKCIEDFIESLFSSSERKRL